MRPTALICRVAACALATFATVSAAAQSAGAPLAYDGGGKSLHPRFVERPGSLEFSGQLIARPRQNLSPADRAAMQAAINASVLKYYPEVDEYILDVTGSLEAAGRAQKGAGENGVAARLMQSGLFEYVHPNWICHPVDNIPNDPQYFSQWHHSVMQSAKAWDITTGSTTIICAFTDTGIDLTHPDLAAHRVPGFNAVTDLAEVDGGDVSETAGHGTHVAGCAAAIGNNAAGVAGVGWNLGIMMCRVQEPGWGGAYLDDILQGARWAIDHGAKIASSSYSGVDYWAIGTTGTYIKSVGGLYCYAAGNDGRDLSAFDYPDTIVVGASHSGEDRTGWSAYGHAVDVFAPGDSILSSCWGGGWCYASGTSMATPVCNGVLAMIWSANPSLTPQQVENILFASCQDWGATGNDEVYGWGRVNTFRAVKAAVAFGSNKPVAVDDYVSHQLAGTARRIDVLANDFDPETQPLTISNYTPTSTLGGTVSISVGTGPDGRDEILYTAPANNSGNDTFSYTVKDPTNLTDVGVVFVSVATLDQFRTPENPAYTAPGIEGRYYVLDAPTILPDFTTLTPFSTVVRPDININPGGGVFGDSGLADNIGAVFEGWITVPQTDWYTLYTNSDDGSKLFIGDTLIVNNDGSHGATEIGGEIPLKAGTHSIRIEFFEGGGACNLIASIAGGGLAKQVIPASMWRHGNFTEDDFRNPDGPVATQPGLDVQYYNTGIFQTTLPNFGSLTPFLSTTVSDLNYASSTGLFANSTKKDGVSALFTGCITVPSTDFYTLYLNSDEGSRLLIGDQVIIDNNGLHLMQERAGVIGLKAGAHTVRIEYFERSGAAGLIASYDSSTLPKQVIPASALVRPNPCPVDFDGSGFADTDDFDAFVVAFEAGAANADFDQSGFVDTDDFDAFVVAFLVGC